jgi:hypothetical protein
MKRLQTRAMLVVLSHASVLFAADCDVPPRFALGNPGTRAAGGPMPAALAVADLDGSGGADLAVSLAGSGEVALHFSRGAGRFSELRTFAAGGEPGAMAPLDADGDGTLDLAVIAAGAVRVFLNDGDWSAPRSVALAAPFTALTLAAADLDGDGRVDLAVANRIQTQNPLSENVSVYLNQGEIQFAMPRHYAIGHQPVSLAIADLDGDGLPEIAALDRAERDGPAQVSLLRNAGGGGFTSAPAFSIGDQPVALAGGDLDGDGDVDLVALSVNQLSGAARQGRLTGLINDGAGRLSVRRLSLLPAPVALAAADFDHDGRTDVAVADEFRSVLVLLAGPDFSASVLPWVDVGLRAETLVAGDFNADGVLDLALSRRSSETLIVLHNRGEASAAAPLAFLPPVRLNVLVGADMAAGDLDGDGDLDFMAPQFLQGTFVRVLANPGDGWLAPIEGFNSGGRGGKLLLADVDGDGDLDVFGGHRREQRITLHANDGAARFSPAFQAGGIEIGDAFAAGDLDGDGDVDLVTGDDGRGLLVLRLEGDGFAPPERYVLSRHAFDAAVSDLDGDGDLDLVLAASDVLLLCLNDGSGVFIPGEPVAVSRWRARAVVAADVDGDGAPDLAVPSSLDTSAEGEVVVLWNDGRARFRAATFLPAGRDPVGAAVADFDGDGTLDLAALNRLSFDISLFLGAGGRRFRSVLSVGGTSHSPLFPGDWDGDGAADLLAPAADGRVVLLLNRFRRAPRDLEQGILETCGHRPFHRGDTGGDGTLSLSDAIVLLQYLYLAGTAPGCLDAADADGDGRLDVTDAVFLLLYLFGGGPPPPPPGPPPTPCGFGPAVPGGASLGCLEYEGCA